MINAQCPYCFTRRNAPDDAAGQRVKCPECQKVFALPAPAQAVVASDSDFEDDGDPGIDVIEDDGSVLEHTPAPDHDETEMGKRTECPRCRSVIHLPRNYQWNHVTCGSCRKHFQLEGHSPTPGLEPEAKSAHSTTLSVCAGAHFVAVVIAGVALIGALAVASRDSVALGIYLLVSTVLFYGTCLFCISVIRLLVAIERNTSTQEKQPH